MCLPTYTQGLPEQELPGSGGAGRRGTPAVALGGDELPPGKTATRSAAAPGSTAAAALPGAARSQAPPATPLQSQTGHVPLPSLGKEVALKVTT